MSLTLACRTSHHPSGPMQRAINHPSVPAHGPHRADSLQRKPLSHSYRIVTALCPPFTQGMLVPKILCCLRVALLLHVKLVQYFEPVLPHPVRLGPDGVITDF